MPRNAPPLPFPGRRSRRAALVVSGIAPTDRLTWFMEVVWVIVGLPLVAWRWRAFPLTLLLSCLLALHAVAGNR